jgi:hypothetical protein
MTDFLINMPLPTSRQLIRDSALHAFNDPFRHTINPLSVLDNRHG